MIQGQPDWGKTHWRQAAKSVRGEAHTLYVDTAKLAATFLEVVKPKDNAVIGAYWPIGDELDIKDMLQALSRRGMRLALPRISNDKRDLDFYEWAWGDPLDSGLFNLKEPPIDKKRLVQPDIYLVPLLAFDASGTRLGYGLGHFDSALERKQALKIGLAYDEQEADIPLPAEAHDVRLDAVLTPKRFLRF